ncbi:hypothetical protein [Mangrovihabitans endophyticus]|uniref:Uncharacterized protein n=1 Tax=Mangrovihabitans endophyticus TaxID=1751298 RepID=A0A8J3C783_9ACTN|nr:hypothetical protein [Mangrovihabitans endophyticus]GGL17828.1 hypothetical protein GCM10012284_60580 [Mangrovihabitans endophyticus]
MTTFAVPPTGSPAWREIYPVPPLLRLETVGPWCPLDDSRLQVREDGWGCTACQAGWDFHGEAARWLQAATTPAAPVVRWRPSAVLVLAGLAGCAAVAAGLVALLSLLDEHLVLLFAAVIAAAAVAVVLVPLAGRARDWARYRHNTVRVLDVDGEVRDEH